MIKQSLRFPGTRGKTSVQNRYWQHTIFRFRGVFSKTAPEERRNPMEHLADFENRPHPAIAKMIPSHARRLAPARTKPDNNRADMGVCGQIPSRHPILFLFQEKQSNVPGRMSLLKKYAKVLNEFALNRSCPARVRHPETPDFRNINAPVKGCGAS